MEYQVTIESGPLAQFVSPVAHTHKCKNCAEEMENQTIFSVQQPARALRMKLIKIIEGDFVGKRSPKGALLW